MKKYNLLFCVIFLVLLFYADPVFAGPGGAIAKSFFKTWWGKALGILLFILLFPLIAYGWIVETLKVKRTKKQLRQVGLKNKDVNWLHLEKNFSNIITRVYLAWGKGDMSEVKSFVNHWYWQNQQLVHLNRWESENLKNICSLQSISKIKPIYVELSDDINFEGSKIVISITGYIEDYLIEKATNRVVEGKKGYQDEEHIWVMEYVNGKWLLDDIKNEEYSMEFIKLENVFPERFVSTR